MSFLHGSVQCLWCVLRNDVVQFLSHHVLLNRKGWCFCRQQDKVGKYEIRSGVSSTLGHARSEASKRLNWFLTKDCTRFTTLFGIVLLCLFSTVARVVPITAPRHGTKSLLETLFGCASGPCVHVETHVARTTASLRMTAFASLGTPSKKQHVLNVVHQWLSRVVIVGSADFRC